MFGLILLMAPLAFAQEAEDEPPSTIDIGEAESLGGLDKETHEFLKPARHELPQNPYGQTDFTAYSLEWGEVKIGLFRTSVGALPRTQLSTMHALDAIGVYNGAVKVDALRTGPVDVAVLGEYYGMRVDDYRASQAGGGLQVSAIVQEPWSIHISGVYTQVNATGLPNFDRLPGFIQDAFVDESAYEDVPDDLQDEAEQELENQYQENVDLDVKANTFWLRFATDYRFNRRDSLVFQGGLMAFKTVEKGASWDDDQLSYDLGNLRQSLLESGSFGSAGWAALGWIWSFKQVDVRISLGYGYPTVVPMLLNGFDLSYRFGGKTRTEERRMKRTWRRNRQDLDRDAEE